MINIAKAEQAILDLLPAATTLNGEINTKGIYLVFDSLKVNNPHIADVDYVFRLYIAISTRSKDKRLLYDPLNDALSALLNDFEVNQRVDVGRIVPHSIKGLIVYQVTLTVVNLSEDDNA